MARAPGTAWLQAHGRHSRSEVRALSGQARARGLAPALESGQALSCAAVAGNGEIFMPERQRGVVLSAARQQTPKRSRELAAMGGSIGGVARRVHHSEPCPCQLRARQSANARQRSMDAAHTRASCIAVTRRSMRTSASHGTCFLKVGASVFFIIMTCRRCTRAPRGAGAVRTPCAWVEGSTASAQSAAQSQPWCGMAPPDPEAFRHTVRTAAALARAAAAWEWHVRKNKYLHILNTRTGGQARW